MRSAAVALYATTFFVLSTFALSASSLNVCDLKNGNSSISIGSVRISSQNDVTTKLNGCTTIIGNIYISANYTGSVELPGVTNISGILTTDGWLSGKSALAPALTSISLGDLLYVNAIDLNGASFLQALLLPKVELVGSLKLNQYFPLNLTLPSVTNCIQLSLLGNLTSISMPALRYVSFSFGIDTLTFDATSTTTTGPPITIDLPSLIYSPSIGVRGNISRVSLSALALVGGLMITSFGSQIKELSFPLLRNTTARLYISGPFLKVSLPSLVGASSDIAIDVDTDGKVPLEIDMPKLENATSVVISGFISAFDLPSLKQLTGSLDLLSDNPKFNCDFQCSVLLLTTTHKKLSSNAITGIALGVSMPCVFIIASLGLFLIHRIKREDQPAGFHLRRLGNQK